MFIDGEVLTYTFSADPEPLSVIGQVAVSGTTLELHDVAVYCGEGRVRVALGVGALLRCYRDLAEAAKASGYTRLVITGDRHTGATPGREVSLRRRL